MALSWNSSYATGCFTVVAESLIDYGALWDIIALLVFLLAPVAAAAGIALLIWLFWIGGDPRA